MAEGLIGHRVWPTKEKLWARTILVTALNLVMLFFLFGSQLNWRVANRGKGPIPQSETRKAGQPQNEPAQVKDHDPRPAQSLGCRGYSTS